VPRRAKIMLLVRRAVAARRFCAAVGAHIVEWKHRSRSRRELLTLDEHELSDAGITHAEARTEGRKPFWRK
jgi:uncharacterized protein YjiS (DUF1127 family)